MPADRRPHDGRVHLVEVGGRGGVYHHTIGVAEALAADGIDVVVHTACDAEELGHGVPRCRCLRWSRRPPSGIRQPITATRFLARTVRHLVDAVGVDDIAHVQGLFGTQLTAWMIDRLARGRRRVVFSPHNTFARSGRAIDDSTIRWMARRADVVIAFSDDDVARLAAWGVDAVRADLTHHLPAIDDAERTTWSERLAPHPVALLAGQVRADKRPDVFVAACDMSDVTAAIVGPAADGEDLIGSAVADGSVIRVDGYLPLESFVAAVASSDVVVATHEIGSVSGPLAYARELGVRTVAPAVGGLAEEVTVAVDGDSAHDVARAIGAALDRPPPPARAATDVAAQHLEAYRRAGWSGR